MTARRLTTGVTLVVLVVVVCVMAVWGFKNLTAPIDAGPASQATCAPEDQTVKEYVRRGEVTVSVYNAGERKGLAQVTMDQLERAGFKPGEVNNAPDGIEVDRAEVYTTEADDPDARLVALALGKSTQVVRSDDEFGPGVDVMVGDKFRRLDPKAPRRLELADPETSCEPVP